GVRLHVLEVEAVLFGRGVGRGHVVGQGLGAVDLGLAFAEQVQVRPRQEEHARSIGAACPGAAPRRFASALAHRAPSSFRTASTSAGGTSVTGCTPAGPSRTNVSPSTAFLSRPINVSNVSVSASGGTVIGRS